MRPETTNNNSGKTSCILVLVLFYLLHNFRVVKQENKVHHVKLGIFPPHLHIKFIKIGATVITYEINHFNIAFEQIKQTTSLNIFNMDENGKLLIYTKF